MAELLKMEHISKRFGTVYANKDINLTILSGEIHTLLGENGAGKSTLMNILFGLYQPNEGQIFWKGEAVTIESAGQAVKLGIGMVHQHFMLIEAMTVFENIILGDRNTKGICIKTQERREEIMALSKKYELDIELDKKVTDISVGAQQRVEILKALYKGADLLVLDEPSAALTDIEVVGLFKIMRKLTDEGKAVVFISHKMREVMEISHRITILRAGETISTLNIEDTDPEDLAKRMIGRDLVPSQYEKVPKPEETIIDFTKVDFQKENKHSGVSDLNFSVGKGEIVGIAGVDGNGQSQLAQLLTGVIPPDHGEILYRGKKLDQFTPKAFIGQQVSHIPEDRNKMGLVGNLKIWENIVLKRGSEEQFSHGKGFFLKKKAMKEYADQMQEKYDIRCSSMEQEARNLSGGNQQKIILARELENSPELLVAVHPTRGLDIGATRYVHDSMMEARGKGCGVLLISADFDEVLEMSDRILVLFEGKIVGEFSGENPPIDQISLAMAGK